MIGQYKVEARRAKQSWGAERELFGGISWSWVLVRLLLRVLFLLLPRIANSNGTGAGGVLEAGIHENTDSH